jgi:quinol monooxygenase YgiN
MWNEHTNICTYRVKPGAREKFLKLLRQHWPTLREAGLVTATPAQHFEAEIGGGRHNETGTTFVEIFSWASPDSADLAHKMPEVMAVWEPMGALVESRDGRPAMEFPNFRQLAIDPA